MRSLWLEEALAELGEVPCPPLAGDLHADVCIVGGGYTGLWTALRLKEREPALDVVVVEADVCGGGASGRNGGFVLSWWAKVGTLKKLVGGDEARRLAQASADEIVEIGRFCEAHGIDAHFRHDGWLWAATARDHMGTWEDTLAAAEAIGVSPFRRVDAGECAALAGSATHLGGVFEETAATVQPALLARGLRRVALEHGVRIFEGSRMTALDRARPSRVRTSAGSVNADTVILAMNAWAVSLRELRRALVVVASDVVATEPIPDRLEAIGWTDGMCISDSRLLVNYYRLTRDGRIAFGKGGGGLAFAGRVGDAFEGASPRARDVERSLRFLYPALADVPITHSWTGPIDRNATAIPLVGRLPGHEHIHYAIGFSGNGVGPSAVVARVLASRALRLDDEWASVRLPERPSGHFPRDPGGSFPPEPMRYLGGRVVRAAVARKEAAEDAGRRPSALDARLTKLAPAGLTPTKAR